MTLRYAVTISLLFTERPLLEPPAAVRAQGLDAIENGRPFAEPVAANGVTGGKSSRGIFPTSGTSRSPTPRGASNPVPARSASPACSPRWRTGYSGSVGLEHRPQGCTEESLSWLPREARAGGGAGA
jgi:hypothetical protein